MVSCLRALKTLPDAIHALAHITGGGLPENLPRILPDGLAAHVDTASWQWPDLFRWLQETGNVPMDDMWRTFNCGIGMTLIVDAARADRVVELLRESDETVYRLGHVVKRDTDAVIFS